MHTLISADGAVLAVTLQGGQVCSWCSPDGQDALYTSPLADYSGATAVRGGIPVIFPQFAREGPLMKHGFARMRRWQLLESGLDEGGLGRVRLGLQHCADAVFSHDCTLELDIRFNGLQLQVSLRAGNPGKTGFHFTAALHSYLRTQLATAAVHGLAGCRYRDTARGGELAMAGDPPLGFDGEIDRIYYAVPRPVELHCRGTLLEVSQSGFEDVVVWNPGERLGAAIEDLPENGWQRFVCIEAALIGAPQLLAAGQQWTGSQVLRRVGF